MADKVIRCIEPGCGMDFTLTEGEIAFFQSKGYQEPKRCKPCRQARKAASTPAHDPRPVAAPVEVPAVRPAWDGKRKRRNNYDD